MDIGKQIKYYRTQKRMKQEELAEAVGVSFQAVSKWETGASSPDIALLPKLSVILGVTIDELFELSREEQLERIESSLCDAEEPEETVFRRFEAFLMREAEGKEPARALAALAGLYCRRARGARERASRYARASFELDPENRFGGWQSFLEAEGGVCGDEWYDNHHSVISYFKRYLDERPGSFMALYGLIENLLADGEYDEALRFVDELEWTVTPERAYMPFRYRADAAAGRGNYDEALALVKKGVEASPDAWQAVCNVGDVLKRLGRFEEAIPYYERCFTMQKAPRLTDGLYSVAQLEERLGRPRDAAATKRRILKCLRDEHGVTDGEEVEELKREILRLT